MKIDFSFNNLDLNILNIQNTNYEYEFNLIFFNCIIKQININIGNLFKIKYSFKNIFVFITYFNLL